MPVCGKDDVLLKEDSVEAAAAALFGTAYGLNGPVPDVDIYLDAAGAPDLLDLFGEAGKIGSRMVVVAVQAGKRPVNILHMTYAQKELIGAGGYFPEDVQDVMKIMSSGKYDISSIITHEFPQSELYQALETVSDPDQSLNVIIRYK